MKDYQDQFPNKILTEEEQDWCRKYQHLTFDAPIMYSENVTDEKSFFAMVYENMDHLEECLKDTLAFIRHTTENMESYKKLK